jgi:carbon monoxide dehydrogenase subunit G
MNYPMAHYHAEVSLRLPPDEAFAYLADYSNAVRWDPSVTEATRAGQSFRVVIAFYGKRIPLDLALEQSRPTERLVFTGAGTNDKKVTARIEFTIAADESGSSVAYDATLQLRGLMRLFDKGLQLAFENMGDKAMQGLTAQFAGRV